MNNLKNMNSLFLKVTITYASVTSYSFLSGLFYRLSFLQSINISYLKKEILRLNFFHLHELSNKNTHHAFVLNLTCTNLIWLTQSSLLNDVPPAKVANKSSLAVVCLLFDTLVDTDPIVTIYPDCFINLSTVQPASFQYDQW